MLGRTAIAFVWLTDYYFIAVVVDYFQTSIIEMSDGHQ
jgi:hypothetical protein